MPDFQPSTSSTNWQFFQNPIYSEAARWLCTNRQTGYKTRIGGPLAQILKQYPTDYKLTLLFIREPLPHEHATGTD